MAPPAESDPRIYFAAERTFLAWIRTGLGLMGVGFAVARFGFFLRQLHASASPASTRSNSLSLWSGVAIVVLGVLVNISAVTEHFRITTQLRTGSWVTCREMQSFLLFCWRSLVLRSRAILLSPPTADA